MNNLIIDSLNYYNNLEKKNMEMENIEFIDIELNEKIETLLPKIIYNSDKEKYIKLYNIIGIYNIEYKVFYWAWYLNIKTEVKYFSIKLLQDIGLTINPRIDNYNLSDFFKKKILTTPFFKIKDNIYLIIIIAIGCYLTNVDEFISISNNNFITFIGLYDIEKEKEK